MLGFLRGRKAAARRATWLLCAAVASVLVTGAGLGATPARAYVPGPTVYQPGATTANAPELTESGGAQYLAYDDLSAGVVHTMLLNGSYGEAADWHLGSAGTHYGSGPSISSVAGQGVVTAWTGPDGHIYIAYLTSRGYVCTTDLAYWIQDQTNFIPAGITTDTPWLSTEGPDGAGTLFLTWVDTSTNHLYVSVVIPPEITNCGPTDGFYVQEGGTTSMGTDTSWSGPAFITTGYSGTSGAAGERYWLMWAGTNSAHNLNIAEYTGNLNAFSGKFTRVAKSTEASHATLTDVGAAYSPAANEIVMAYCGTNDDVYYQDFTPGTGGGSEVPVGNGAQCNVNTTVSGGVTYYSGGVGVDYDYSSRQLVIAWAQRGSNQVSIIP